MMKPCTCTEFIDLHIHREKFPHCALNSLDDW